MSKVTEYIVKINDEAVQGFQYLREARRYVNSISLEFNPPEVIEIIKVVTKTEILNTYKPVKKVVLKSAEAFDELTLA